MEYGNHCEYCDQPTNGQFFIMAQQSDGTWIERVNGSDPEPSDLYCCYDCSEQLAPPRACAQDDIDLDDIVDDWPTEANVSIYLLLKNKLVVYVGITGNLGRRIKKHYRKGKHFDDVIETPDGPYRRAEAERREKILIRCYLPTNKVHINARITKKEERELLGWLSCWPEGADALGALIERILRFDLASGMYTG